MTPELERLIAWIAENTEAEPMSSVLPWGPVWNVNSDSLLDAVADIWGLQPEEVGAVVERVNTGRAAVDDRDDGEGQ